MKQYNKYKQILTQTPRKWVVTGVAGFIGSNLLEQLLKLDQKVIGLDNFATGHQHNLDQVKELVSSEQWSNFEFIEGDILNLDDCLSCSKSADYILHQAALGSVPRSINDPITTNENNIKGFLNILVAARDNNVSKVVYAASSSTYGDHKGLPKKENVIGKPLSPYAITKYVNELYAEVFKSHYNLDTVGLRYFNVFGKRQDPNGAYAAVIPKWISSLIKNEETFINGDGETSRDFCFIDNAVQANILAATSENKDSINQIYNVAVGQKNSLNKLHELIQENLATHFPNKILNGPAYRDFRQGDVRHSLADISKAQSLLGYAPTETLETGIKKTIDWHLKHNQH